MHVLIDDFAWIAIGLVLVAFLFMIGAAYILIVEGLKSLAQSFRKIAGRAHALPQSNTANPVATDAYFSRPRMGDKRPACFVASLRRLTVEVGRVLTEMVEEARVGIDLRLRLRHHKP